MRIGIDARFLGPESKGLGRYTQKLLTHLQDIEDRNRYVIFLRKDNYDLFEVDDPRFEKVLADYQWYSFSEQIFFLAKLWRAKCDLVHFPHFNVPIFYMRPFIVTIHDLILLRFPTHDNSSRGKVLYWLKYQVYKFVIARAIRHATKIAAVSKFTREDIVRQYKVPREKIFLTYESGSEIDMKNVNNILAESAVHSIIEDGYKYFLYVGNAYPHKNLEILVESFVIFLKAQNKKGSDLKDLRLILVGRKDVFYERLESVIGGCARRYDMEDFSNRIVILDTVSNGALSQLYRNAHAFIFTSLYEGFGLPPLEACAHGIPVLSSQLSSMPEILGDAVLYCDVQDVHAVALNMERIAGDIHLRENLHIKGPLQAKKFSWKRMVQQTHSLYSIHDTTNK